MENITIKFLKKIDEIARQPIPDKVMLKARYSLLDYICVTLAGSKYNREKIEKYLKFAEPEEGAFTAIGLNKKLALKETVFLNGLNSHVLDFDDGTNTGIIHLGAPIFSVLLPLAQKYHIDYYKMLKAAIIGYETSFTMAVSIQPDHKLMGYHATGTCGILGAVLAIAYLLDFSEEDRKNAFATAGVSATGMLKVLDDGSELKPYNVAKTALLALTSAQLAKTGIKGNQDVLSGDRGYLKMMTGKSDVHLKNPLYKGTYAIEKAYTKPYAACRYCHPSIEAAINLRSNYLLEEIQNINIKTYSLAVKGHEHTVIPSVASAKMSIPYSVAVGTIYGKAGLTEYTENVINDKKVLALCKKITVLDDQVLSAAFPEQQTAIVEVKTLTDSFSTRVDFPKGEPENPMNEFEFKCRYVEMCKYANKPTVIYEKIYEMIINSIGTVSDLMDLL